MTTDMEQNGDAAKMRLKPEYEACIDELIGAALSLDSGDIDEYDVLAKIMVRAGAAWRCLPCGGINRQRNATCDNCSARRAKMRDIPKQEAW